MVNSKKPGILIVTAETLFAPSLAQSLSDLFVVLMANSGRTALEILAKQTVDAVVADQLLPDMSGVQLLTQVSHHRPPPVGYLASSDAGLAGIVDALSHGIIRGLIGKPLDPAALRLALADTIRPPEPDSAPHPLVRDAAEAEQELSSLTRLLQAVTAPEVDALLDGPRVWLAQSQTGQPLKREYLENLSDGFALLRGEGEVVYCNPAFARLLSLVYPLPPIITLLSIPHLAACAPLVSTLRAGLRGERAHLAFSLFDNRGGRRYLEMAATGVTADPGTPQAVLLVRDETQREQMLTHLKALNSVAETVSQSADFNQGLVKVLEDSRRAVAGDAGLVCFLNEEHRLLELALVDQFSEETSNYLIQHPLQSEEGLLRSVTLEGQTRAVADLRSQFLLPPTIRDQEGLVSAICAPLRDPHGISGVLIVGSRRSRLFSDADLQLLASVGRQVGLARHNAHLHAELRAQARTDPLTGLLNRRAFMELAEHEYLRARRQGSSLAVLMIDLNDFKAVNDRYGHAVGDQVLRAVAHTLQTNVRDVDLAARYGGDEFVLLLPDCNGEAAQQVALRLEEHVSAERISANGDVIVPSLSVGSVAAALEEGETLGKLLSASDESMYAAKQRKKQLK